MHRRLQTHDLAASVLHLVTGPDYMVGPGRRLQPA